MSVMEILLVILIILIFFAPKRLPRLGKDFGRLFRDIREGIRRRR